MHEEKKEAKESDVTCGKPGQQAPSHRCRGIQVQPKCYLPQILPILLSTQGTLLEKMSKDSRKCFTHMTQVSRSSIAGLFFILFLRAVLDPGVARRKKGERNKRVQKPRAG